ncbi:MAG: hypothetical protein HOC63_17785 [Rhodospirillales bacterium]|jgi:hypothetical protein|nr:hypothetical protein [Rhodospirillales bacterium]MBT4687356.1 hypothetical protein [Rhodospirillaceae bacterium]MBT5080627.1 hypothetical protein [Rhodospirillaceae bacterium]MBT5879186.1 hypothetical protein [Rhodospirillaceae bacterium]MBT6592053.1 hypothetical protein [Rhodospirillaceae bacterium]
MTIDIIKEQQESFAHLKFDAVDTGGLQGRGTLDEWLDKSKGEFVTAGFMLITLNKDHEQLKEAVEKTGDGDPGGDDWMELIEAFIDQKERHAGLAEMYEAAFARLMIVMEQLIEEGRLN